MQEEDPVVCKQVRYINSCMPARKCLMPVALEAMERFGLVGLDGIGSV